MSYAAPNLPQKSHKFFGNSGGVSKGKYASLNVNYKSLDNIDDINKNIEIVANSFNLSKKNIFLPNQVHSNKVVFASSGAIRQVEADGCVSDNKDLLLLITTADCIPVLLRDDVCGLVAAAHSGWPGSLSGVVNNTIEMMTKHGSDIKNIKVALGPCLQQASFVVQVDLYDKFLAENKDNAKYFEPQDKGYLFNHLQYLIDKIKSKGIKDISYSDIDTYTNLDYFSFRRNTHQGTISQNDDFGVQASVIRL